MAKLGILPLIQYLPGSSTLPWQDGLTSTSWDSATHTLRSVIDFAPLATITVGFDPQTNHSIDISVDIEAGANALTASRVNRLLQGTGAPRLEKYHRTGRYVVRAKGSPVDVPVSFSLRRDSNAFWVLKSDASGKVFSTPAPAAPVGIPTPPPAATGLPPSLVGVANGQGGYVPPAATPAPVVEAAAQEQAPPEMPDAPTDAPEIEPPAPVQALDLRVDAAPADPAGLFYFPARATTDNIITSKVNRKVLDAAWQQHVGGERAAIALVGPAGTGKTSIIDDLAAEHGVGVFNFDAAGASSFVDWTGTTALTTNDDGGTVTRFVPSSFIEAIRADGPYGDTLRVVRVDEVNRAETGGALNALMPILSQASLYIPETGQTVPVSHAVFFAFTLNRGSAYAGTVTLDAALADRMQAWVMLDYLDVRDETDLLVNRTGLDEATSMNLVKTAHQVREIASRGEITTGVSTRRVLQAARMVKHGLSAREAAEFCWANAYADEGGTEGERGIVLIAINSVLTD